FAANAAGIQGSGWSVLGWDSLGQRLAIFQLYDQQSNVPVSITPLFMLDMWEHAFYLDYLNVKADYIKAVWNIANWQDVSARLAKAQAPGTVWTSERPVGGYRCCLTVSGGRQAPAAPPPGLRTFRGAEPLSSPCAVRAPANLTGGAHTWR